MLKKYVNLLLAGSMIFVAASCSQGGQQEATEEETTGAEMETTAAETDFANGTYAINEGQAVEWVGKKVTGQHNGTIEVEGGQFMVENGNITGGSFQIDLNTIKALDLKDDPESQAKLEGHLKSNDFFSVETSPMATFEITNIAEGGEGDATHTVTGNLTIKNITNEISFPATVSSENGSVTVSADTQLDRTRWDMMFHSGLEEWGDKAIYDEFEISFDLTASRQSDAS